MRIILLLSCFLVSNYTFSQFTDPHSTKQLFYTYNGNSDTLFFNIPEFNGLLTCDVQLIDTIDYTQSGRKEYVFLKTCNGWFGRNGATFSDHVELRIKTYEIWDLDKKKQLFSATFSYDHWFSFYRAALIIPNTSGYDKYEYHIAILKDKILISNLKMAPLKLETDSNGETVSVNQNIKPDNEAGVYLFHDTSFIKQAPLETIKTIFNAYISNQENIDTEVNKDLMRVSLKSLTVVTDQESLVLLINVWMYYDPTDFHDIPSIYTILKNSRPQSIEAVKNRIANKKEWENEGSAPYSDLKGLLKRLEDENDER
ncbi:MAG TPA: hypothetical protein DIW47_01760 [Bacteroidetes bacterium]|nr:hypothetical protein [Bacteroidota bacterium]